MNIAAFFWFSAFGLGYLRLTGKTPNGFEPGAFAESLRTYGTYAWGQNAPWAMPGGALTAHKGPLLSGVLALVGSAFPETLQPGVTTLFNAAAEALALVGIVKTAPAPLAPWVRAVFCTSPFILMNIPVTGDMALTQALLAWACYFIVNVHNRWQRAAFAGLLSGLAALSLPASIIFAALFAAWLLSRGGPAKAKAEAEAENAARKRPQLAAAFIIAAALVVTPWMVRNAVVFHRFIPLASNFPLELYYGNNARASGGMFDATTCAAVTTLDDTHKALLAGDDEPTGYARLGREAQVWIVHNPAQAMGLRLEAFAYFWHPQAFWLGQCQAYAGMRWRVFAAINVMYLLGALGGLWCFHRGKVQRSVIVATYAALACVTALYTITHADIGWRYRAPIEPILCVLCAIAARQLFCKSPKARRTNASCSAK